HHREVELLLAAGQRRRAAVERADRVDQELGLAVAARSHHREIDHRGDVVVRIGQRGESAQLGDRLVAEQRRPSRRGGIHRAYSSSLSLSLSPSLSPESKSTLKSKSKSGMSMLIC